MGFLDLLMPGSGIAKWADSHQNTLGAIGSGLAQGPTFSAGLADAAQLMPKARTLDRSFQQDLRAKNATAEWIKGKYPDLGALLNSGAITALQAANEAFAREAALAKAKTVDPSKTAAGRQQLADQYGLTGAAKTSYILTGNMPGGNQSTRAGVGQPVYGRNKKTGAYIPFEPMTNGTLVNTVDPDDPASNYDFDPYFASAQRAGGTWDAKAAATARAALPAAQQALDITNKAIAAIQGNPTGEAQQFGNILGFPTQKLPAFPGSSMANFRNDLTQLTGQAFLQARQMLKGGGQITDYEGAKAEAAYSKMQLAASNGDRQAFDQALMDFQAAVQEGYQKLLAAAQGGYAAGPVPSYGGGASAGQPGNLQNLKLKYGLD